MGPFGDTSLNFDHIVIGTQKENTYTVYLYNLTVLLSISFPGKGN